MQTIQTGLYPANSSTPLESGRSSQTDILRGQPSFQQLMSCRLGLSIVGTGILHLKVVN